MYELDNTPTLPSTRIDEETQRPAALPVDRSAPLDVEQAASYLSLSISSVYHAVAARRLACFKIGGGRLLRFHRDDLNAFAYSNRIASRDELLREAARKDATLRADQSERRSGARRRFRGPAAKR
jgi:excisionase family DNA binding protein